MPRRVKPKRQSHIRGKQLLSEYPGVTFERGVYRRKPWKAYIFHDGRQIYLGRHEDEGTANATVQAYKDSLL